MARAMVTRYGMEPEIGQASFVAERPRYLDLPALGPLQSEASDETNAKIDAAIRKLVDQAFDRATAILQNCAMVHKEFGAASARQGNLWRGGSGSDTSRSYAMRRWSVEDDSGRWRGNFVRRVEFSLFRNRPWNS